jgi:hypothetical protein
MYRGGRVGGLIVTWVGSLLPALRLFFLAWSFLVVLVLLLTGFVAVALWLARRVRASKICF